LDVVAVDDHPLGVYSAPSAYNALSGAMTGKGISGTAAAPATPTSPMDDAQNSKITRLAGFFYAPRLSAF